MLTLAKEGKIQALMMAYVLVTTNHSDYDKLKGADTPPIEISIKHTYFELKSKSLRNLPSLRHNKDFLHRLGVENPGPPPTRFHKSFQTQNL